MAQYSNEMTTFLAEVDIIIEDVEFFPASKDRQCPEVCFKKDLPGKIKTGTYTVFQLINNLGLNAGTDGEHIMKELEKLKAIKKKIIKKDNQKRGRDATEQAVAVALGVYKRFIKTREVSSVVIAYTLDPRTNQTALFGANVNASLQPVINNLCYIAGEYYPREYAEACAQVEEIGRAAAGGAGKPLVTWQGASITALQEILQGNHPDCKLTGLDVFRWDNHPTNKIPENTYVMCKLDWGKLCEGPTPYFDAFLSRVDYPEQFMAWVWKVYDDTDDTGRQLAWCTSRGNAGASTAVDAIFEPLSAVRTALVKGSNTDSFSDATLYLKRVAVMGDCRDPHYVDTQQVRKVTGGDITIINSKYSAPFPARVWSRIFVTSNIYPSVDTSDNSLNTRLLLFKLMTFEANSSKKDMRDLYREEIWHFLYKCKQVHDRLCSDGCPVVPVPAAMETSMLINCEPPARRALKFFVDSNVSFDTTSTILQTKLWERFLEYVKKHNAVPKADISKLRLDNYKDVLVRRLEMAAEKVGRRVGSETDSYGNVVMVGVNLKDVEEECEL